MWVCWQTWESVMYYQMLEATSGSPKWPSESFMLRRKYFQRNWNFVDCEKDIIMGWIVVSPKFLCWSANSQYWYPYKKRRLGPKQHSLRDDHARTCERMTHCKMRREASGETKPATPDLGLLASKQWENKLLLLKPHSLWCFTMAALAITTDMTLRPDMKAGKYVVYLAINPVRNSSMKQEPRGSTAILRAREKGG